VDQVITLLLVAAALVVWPAARHRLVAVRHGARFVGRPWWWVATGSVVVAVSAGPAAGLASALAAATGVRLGGRAVRQRRDRIGLIETAEGLGLLGRELRSGADPVAAVGAAAGAASGAGAAVLRAVSAQVRWGLESGPGDTKVPVAAARVADGLGRGWSLARRYGIPWAALVDVAAADLEAELTAIADRSAQVAGPRFSGLVLAAIPLLGVLLGSGMGADPLTVLFGSGTGAVLLIVGTALTCAGLLWSDRIVAP
jgi:tight adherence protein B